MAQIIISKQKIEKRGGMVMLPLKEYQQLLKRAAPTYYLTGKEARKIDKLAEQGLGEYKAGKTRKINSLADLI